VRERHLRRWQRPPGAHENLGVAATPGAPVASGDQVLATLPPLITTRMSAYAGQVVWSQPVAPERYVLMRWQHGQVDRLPTSPQPEPFDVDVGPDARGRPVAVYSRCTGLRVRALAPVGCDVYQLSLAGGRERKLRRVSSSHASEYAPTIWRGNLAYASTRTSSSRTKVLLLRRAARRPVRLPGGSRGSSGDVGQLDLTSNALVFTWRSDATTQLWRVPLSGRRGTLLATGFIEEGNAKEAESPNAAPDETIWVDVRSTPCMATSIVSDRPGQRRQTAPLPRDIRALARDGTTLYAITSAPAPCSRPSDVTLVRLAPLTFSPT
jgi:hypothetical protein